MKNTGPTGPDHPLAVRRRGFARAALPAYRSLVAGTQVRTLDGTMPVEDLAPGDLVLTADHGFRQLRHVLRRRIGGRGPAAPVLISAGTFGNSRDLRLSQDQRIVLPDPRATAPPGTAGLLAEIRYLLNGHSVRLSPCAGVDYIQLAFDHAELIFAEDMLTETASAEAHPKAPALRAMATAADLAALLPDLMRPQALPDLLPADSAMAAPRVRPAAAKPQTPV